MKLYNENGHLNDYGKDTLNMFLGKELDILMNSADTEQELLTLKAVLAKYMADRVSERLVKMREEVK